MTNFSPSSPFFESFIKDLSNFAKNNKVRGGKSLILQLATSIINQEGVEPNVDLAQRTQYLELFKLIQMHFDELTEQDSSGLNLICHTRNSFSEVFLEQWYGLLSKFSLEMEEKLKALEIKMTSSEPKNPFSTIFELAGVFMPEMLNLEFGSLLGNLSKEVFGLCDSLIPLSTEGTIHVIPRNADDFSNAWGLDAREARLFVLAHEMSFNLFFSKDFIREKITGLLKENLSFSIDNILNFIPKMAEQNLSEPDAQELIDPLQFNPELFFNYDEGPQVALAENLKDLLALGYGFGDFLLSKLTERFFGNKVIFEAYLRRRLERSDAKKAAQDFFNIELSNKDIEKGFNFIQGVVARQGIRFLLNIIRDKRFLPTSSELEAPGLYVERVLIDLSKS